MRVAALRRALLPVVVAATAVLGGASAAGAQTISLGYSPSCGPGTGCATARFSIINAGTTSLLVNTLTLLSTNSAFRFAPLAGGDVTYQGFDILPFVGVGTVAAGGTQMILDFSGRNGFPFELAPLTTGYVNLTLTETPAVAGGAFTYTGRLENGTAFTGSVAVLPEPATVVLLGSGLALVGLVARRRRHA